MNKNYIRIQAVVGIQEKKFRQMTHVTTTTDQNGYLIQIHFKCLKYKHVHTTKLMSPFIAMIVFY